MEHQWPRQRGQGRCKICGLPKPPGRKSKLQGHCPGSDRIEEALARALSPSGTITLALVSHTGHWQERLGGTVAYCETRMEEWTNVGAIELASDGSYILWRLDNGGFHHSMGHISADYHYQRTPTKMRDDTAMARIIDGQVWVQPPKQPEDQ